ELAAAHFIQLQPVHLTREVLGFLESQSRGNQEALHYLATMCDQPVALCYGLDAFGNHFELQIAPQVDDGTDHSSIAWRVQHIGDEQSIDLQRIQFEVTQVGQG